MRTHHGVALRYHRQAEHSAEADVDQRHLLGRKNSGHLLGRKNSEPSTEQALLDHQGPGPSRPRSIGMNSSGRWTTKVGTRIASRAGSTS